MKKKTNFNSVVETTNENTKSSTYSNSEKIILANILFRTDKTAADIADNGGNPPMQETHRRFPGQNIPGNKVASQPAPAYVARPKRFAQWRKLSLLQRIFISNVLIISGGAVIGSWLTAQLTEAGSFNAVTFGFMIVCATLMSGSISFLILKLAFRPFDELQRVLSKVHDGNSRARLSLQQITDPDVRQFTTALNHMLSRLEENAKVIQEDQVKLQVMTARVIEAQENERKRIARELHDEASQSLTAMIMGLDAARRQAKEESLQNKLGSLKDMAVNTLEELRKLALDLRPTMLDDLGLVPAVRWLSRSATEHAGFEVKLELEGCNDHTRLAPEIETCLFRITQESLTNITKHAGATLVKIRLNRAESGEIHLTVADNGKGFDRTKARHFAVNGGHLGLFDIEERASLIGGKAEITTSPAGTTISITLPPQSCAIILPDGINTNAAPYTQPGH
jgi:two-component system sensor histidine kinase UhpB